MEDRITDQASTRENTACKKVPAYTPLPFEEYPRADMRVTRRDLFKNPFFLLPPSPPPSLRPIPSPAGNKRTRRIEEAGADTGFRERLRGNTRRRLLLFHFPGRNLIWNASSCTFPPRADWYEETKPRKITRKMYVLRVQARPRSPGAGRERIRNFTNSDSRI